MNWWKADKGLPFESGENQSFTRNISFFSIAFDNIQMSPFLVGIDEMFMVEYLRMVSII